MAKEITVDLSDLQRIADKHTEIIKDNPWLIPAGLALELIPLALFIHGRAQNGIYRKKLQIEREKTRQLMLQSHGHCHHHYKHKGGHGHHGPDIKQLADTRSKKNEDC